MEPHSLDILATPASSRLGYSTDETSSDEETNDGPLDLSRLQHVYQALMSTIVDLQQTQQMETSSPNEERQPSLVPEVGQQDDGVSSTASGAAKNAKRRKMDKKKAKREEQKRSAEETVDVVEFKLLSRMSVKPISLLPPEEPTWTTKNPRHISLSPLELLELRQKIASVVVDGADIGAINPPQCSRGRQAGRVYIALERVHTNSPSSIFQLVARRSLPPFSNTFLTTHASYTPPSNFSKPPGTISSSKKKSQHSTIKPSSIAPIDPVCEALKRTAIQRKSRAPAHVVFTVNGKPLPSHTPAAAQALSRDAQQQQQGVQGGKVPSLDVLVPGTTMASKENKERKAHLRRVARRAERMKASGTLISTTASPWAYPSIGTGASFFAPSEGTGGKSGGYGYGFAASSEGVRERESQRRRGGIYVRDRMR